MPTIISGLDPSVRMNAYLQGQKFQTELQRQQAEEAMQQQQLRQKYLSDIQSYRAQQAKALEDVNARAQMGDVIALRQQELEAKAAGLPVDEKMIQSRVELGKNIQSPPARAQY